MPFICVSDYSFLPKTTAGCNWKNIQFYYSPTQLLLFYSTNPVLYLAPILWGGNDIYEGSARIGC